MDTSPCTYLKPAILLMIFLASAINLSDGKLVIRLRANLDCPASGYFRDETDCTRFYRCAQHPTQVGHSGKQQYTKAQFRCPAGTIFDELLSNCNHLIFVKNLPPECSNTMGGISAGGSSTGRPPSTTTTRSTTPTPTTTTLVPHPTPTSTAQPPPSSQYPVTPDRINPPSGMFPLVPNVPNPPQIVQVNVQQPPSPPQQPGLQLMMPSAPIMPIIQPQNQLQIESNHNQHNSSPDQTLQNIIESSPSTSSNTDGSNLAGGWLIPASFPSASSSPSGWVVPEKFPTLFSIVSTPFLLPQQGFMRNGARKIELYL